jgi:hypothetical protein
MAMQSVILMMHGPVTRLSHESMPSFIPAPSIPSTQPSLVHTMLHARFESRYQYSG